MLLPRRFRDTNSTPSSSASIPILSLVRSRSFDVVPQSLGFAGIRRSLDRESARGERWMYGATSPFRIIAGWSAVEVPPAVLRRSWAVVFEEIKRARLPDSVTRPTASRGNVVFLYCLCDCACMRVASEALVTLVQTGSSSVGAVFVLCTVCQMPVPFYRAPCTGRVRARVKESEIPCRKTPYRWVSHRLRQCM